MLLAGSASEYYVVGGMEERKLAEDGDDGLDGRAGEDGRDVISADGRTWARRWWGGNSRNRARRLHHGSPSRKEEGTWVTSEFGPIITFDSRVEHNVLIGKFRATLRPPATCRTDGVIRSWSRADSGRAAADARASTDRMASLSKERPAGSPWKPET